jgi:predicted negative regulator of RcsB-dependent stress response
MSKKHPGAARVKRQRHDEDVFVESVLEGSVWAKTHGRTLVYVGVAVFLLLAAGIYYRNFQQNARERSTVELNQVRQTVLSGNKQLAQTDLRQFVAKYGDTQAGEEARTMLAQLYLSTNQPQQAIDVIRPIADDVDESPAAAFLMAGAYEALKQPEKAEETYLRIADKARFGFEKREALERAAGLRMAKGNTAGAIELYDRALNSLPEESPDRSVYEMRIAEARGASAGAS